jgi:negative regulator of flagellin synthesis FlgM
MALYDISRLTGPGALRPVARDFATAGKGEARSLPASQQPPADKGLAVETGSRIAAGSVPVDNERVAQIREALRDGSYPIVPAQISDAIIAARMMLSSQ